MQYVPNTGSTVIINEFVTGAGSGYVINLQSGSIYQFTAYNLSGSYLATTPYIQASCASGTVCSYNIPVGRSEFHAA